ERRFESWDELSHRDLAAAGRGTVDAGDVAGGLVDDGRRSRQMAHGYRRAGRGGVGWFSDRLEVIVQDLEEGALLDRPRKVDRDAHRFVAIPLRCSGTEGSGADHTIGC